MFLPTPKVCDGASLPFSSSAPVSGEDGVLLFAWLISTVSSCGELVRSLVFLWERVSLTEGACPPLR